MKNFVRKTELSISRFSMAQKLDLLETLWAELSKDEKTLKSPAWHKSLICDRVKRFSSGKVAASDWDQAKNGYEEGFMRIKLLAEAETDLEDGFHFYESQSPGLGSYFLDSLCSDIDSLAYYAGVHIKIWGFQR